MSSGTLPSTAHCPGPDMYKHPHVCAAPLVMRALHTYLPQLMSATPEERSMSSGTVPPLFEWPHACAAPLVKSATHAEPPQVMSAMGVKEGNEGGIAATEATRQFNNQAHRAMRINPRDPTVPIYPPSIFARPRGAYIIGENQSKQIEL